MLDEVHLDPRQFRKPRPDHLIWSAKDLEYLQLRHKNETTSDLKQVRNTTMKSEDRLTLSSCSTSVLPLNSGSFDNSSAIIHPRDHISIAVEYNLVPKRSSGALKENK